MWLVDLIYNFECDWLVELSDNKLSDNKVSDNKLSDNNLTGELGPDYMANFIPGWNFRPASETNPLKTKLSITWRGIQPGLKILARYSQTG